MVLLLLKLTNCLYVRQNAGWDKMATIWGTTFSNALSWMKTAVFSFKCHWSMFLRVQLIKSHHGSGNGKVPNSQKAINLNLWPSSMVHYKSITRPQWVEMFSYLSCWLLCTSTLQRCQMTVTESLFTGQSSVCSTVYSDLQQRNIKGPCYFPLWRDSTGFPPQRDSNLEMFPFYGIIMTWLCLNAYLCRKLNHPVSRVLGEPAVI